jgi:hypothetical protein
LGSSSKQWKELRTKKVFINNIELMSAKFGGTGVDGALNISSGTTTINLGGQRLVVKNYTSISITGTGKLTFTNPHSNGTIIVLKSQGNVTLTSSTNPNIDVSGLGGNSNTSGWGFVCGPSSESYGGYSATFRGSEQSLMTPNPGVGTHIVPTIESLTIPVFCGAGGGSGVIGGGPGDPYGGRGGGGLYIECGGDLNMTGNIWAKGQNGGTSSYPLDLYNAIAGSGGGGAEDGSCGQFTWRLIGYQTIGFGGGGGGCVYILYRGTLVAASGTIDVSGGSGGSGAASGGSGGAGSYNIEKNQYIN